MPETLLRLVVLVLPVALVPLLLRPWPGRSPATALLRTAAAGLLGIVIALVLLEIRRRLIPTGFASASPEVHALVAAFSEEAAKLAAFLVVFRPRSNDGTTGTSAMRPILRTAGAAALVFAVIENALYFTVPLSLLWTRALVVPALHAGCTVVVVVGVLELKRTHKAAVASLFIFGGVAVHAVHNYLMLMSRLPFVIRLTPALLVVGAALYLHYRSPNHSI
ncbi:MAG: PrsW family intramembrane metalloprotease [Spirochaetaceae bacterium]|nr:MAG: PrsW family intramembrane metalloprotease [Spirochaetaceae bacterium]